jgi:hypothetical protein
VRGRTTGARVREFKGVHIREHAGAELMAAGQDGGDVTVIENRQGGRPRKGSVRGVVGSNTCKRLLPSLARWPASHSATARWHGSDTTRRSRVNASLARRLGAKGGRDEDALTYGLRDQKVKAAVKKRSV